MNPELRLLWWNVSWQHRNRTADQINAVRTLPKQPNVLALCEVNAHTERVWRDAFPNFLFADPPASLSAGANRVQLGAHEELRFEQQEHFFELDQGTVRSGQIEVGKVTIQ